MSTQKIDGLYADFEKVALGADIGDRPPDRRGDVRLLGVGEAERTEIERIREKAVATASLGSFSFGAALRLQLMRTKRSAEPIVPGRKLRPLTPFQ